MKKFAVISLIMLMAVSAFSQTTGKTGYRTTGEKEKAKKEAVKKDNNDKRDRTAPSTSTERKSTNSGNEEKKRVRTENTSTVRHDRNTVNTNNENIPNSDNKVDRGNSIEHKKTLNNPEKNLDRSTSNNTGKTNDENRNASSGNMDRNANNGTRNSDGEDRFRPSRNNPVTNPADGNRRYVYRSEQDNTSVNRVYTSNHTRYDNRTSDRYVNQNRPEPIEIRRDRYPIRQPRYVNIYWTNDMLWEYRNWYPEYRFWNYPIGYRLMTISAYDAFDYVGEVARVYGKVEEVYYASMSDEYYLYIGAWFPYHDLCIVVPGNIARRFSHRPVYYFTHTYVTVTGFITEFDGRPEILVKRPGQLDRYYR